MIILEYDLHNHLIFEIDERNGDIVRFFVNGVDKSSNGDAIDAAMIAVIEAGHNFQLDISVKADSYRRDECRLAKGNVELEMERRCAK